MILEGSRIRLRPVQRADTDRWLSWINDPEIAGFLDRVLPVSVAEHERFFELAVVGNEHAVWYAIERLTDGVYLGNVWLWDITSRHRKAEIRILIGERSAWNSGAGTEALQLIAEYAFAKLGLHKVYAYVMARNPRALSAFRRAGFATEAELPDEVFWDGEFQDCYRVSRMSPNA